MYKKFFACTILYFARPDVAIQGQKTYLDTPENIRLLRNFRYRMFDMTGGGTSKNETLLQAAINDGKVQTRVGENVTFPCDVTIGKSRDVPKNVHQLRPGDIDIVAAMGDSIVSAAGALSTRAIHSVVENRGVSALGGGQGNWREYLTLPNILKEFNPDLYGYSLSDSFVTDEESKFNVAESFAMTIDLPNMADLLIRKIKSDPRVDVKNHWKLISLMIGANDFCFDICYRESPTSLLEDYEKILKTVLTTFMENLPRTIVSIVTCPNVRNAIETVRRPLYGQFLVHFACPCLIGSRFRKNRSLYYDIMRRRADLEYKVAKLPEFKRDDFAIIIQPFPRNFTVPRKSNGKADVSYLAADTYHPSQKANARFANSLWNNMMEPDGTKSIDWTDTFKTFLCPTPKRPYISTLYN